MNRIKPAKAIKIECGFCTGKTRPCGPSQSKHCALADKTIRASLQKIRKHCIECAPDHRVAECTGFLIGTQARMLAAITGQPLTEDGKAQCTLFDYRYGRNPHRKHVMTPKRLEAFERAKAGLRLHQNTPGGLRPGTPGENFSPFPGPDIPDREGKAKRYKLGSV